MFISLQRIFRTQSKCIILIDFLYIGTTSEGVLINIMLNLKYKYRPRVHINIVIIQNIQILEKYSGYVYDISATGDIRLYNEILQ